MISYVHERPVQADYGIEETTVTEERQIRYISEGAINPPRIGSLRLQPHFADNVSPDRGNSWKSSTILLVTSPGYCLTTSVKLMQILLASITLACLLSQCKFTNYLTDYCYRQGTAFDLQNIPVSVAIIQLLIGGIFLICWIVNWQENTGVQQIQRDSSKSLRKGDGVVNAFLFFLSLLATIVEIAMVIKFSVGYSCPMCHNSFLWSLAACAILLNTLVHLWTAIVFLKHRNEGRNPHAG